MELKWLPKTPDQLRKQSEGLLKLAANARNSRQAQRLKDQASALLAEAGMQSRTTASGASSDSQPAESTGVAAFVSDEA